jgi:hypothetical protein
MDFKSKHINFDRCPTCGSTWKNIGRDGRAHTNGDLREKIVFQCGCTIEYSPNFWRTEEQRECQYNIERVMENIKRQKSLKRLDKYISRLDVSSNFQESLKNEYKYNGPSNYHDFLPEIEEDPRRYTPEDIKGLVPIFKKIFNYSNLPSDILPLLSKDLTLEQVFGILGRKVESPIWEEYSTGDSELKKAFEAIFIVTRKEVPTHVNDGSVSRYMQWRLAINK